jgi:hypothetical protein
MTKIHIDIQETLKYILTKKNIKILKIVFGGLGGKLLADFGFSQGVLETLPPPMKSGG